MNVFAVIGQYLKSVSNSSTTFNRKCNLKKISSIDTLLVSGGNVEKAILGDSNQTNSLFVRKPFNDLKCFTGICHKPPRLYPYLILDFSDFYIFEQSNSENMTQ